MTTPPLIGCHARVHKSSNPYLVGLHGSIIDETKNTLVVRTPKGCRIIPKDHNVWRIRYRDDEILVPGTAMRGRFYERLSIS